MWRLLTTFLLGQGASQVVRMVAGFLVIRWLTKDDYATFTLVLAIQGTSAVLVELGFSGGLLALIGKRFRDPEVAGRYIGAVRFYRTRLLLIGGTVLALVFAGLSFKYGWSPLFAGVLWLAVVASLAFEAKASFYSPILELHQKVKEMYVVDVGASLFRLALLAFAQLLQILTAPVALLIGAVQVMTSAAMSRRYASRFIRMPDPSEDLKPEKKELLQLTLPKIAGSVFFAFQGPVTVYLAGIFGQYTDMAELGALNKIGMLFMVPGTFAGMLLVPWFAKQEKGLLLRAYLAIMAVYAGFGVALAGAALLVPGLFLMVLGEGYQNLEWELFLFAISSSFSMLSGLSYQLTACRKWVFYWTGPASIVGYLGILVYFLAFVDLSVIANLIVLSILNGVLLFLIHQVVFVVGYRRDPADEAEADPAD